MRIVGGRLRGRRLAAPEGISVRPTADRTRESLFNVLTQGKLAETGNPLIEARVLDAFAGTGALGLEALSRGAAAVTFMESQAAALAALRENITGLELDEQARVLDIDVLRPPKAAEPAQIVLMDPPYNQDLPAPALKALAAAGWVAPGAVCAVELMKTESFEVPQGFGRLDDRSYGKARVLFLSYLG